MSKWTYAGIEESDGQACECCGTPCPKARVVLRSEDGEFLKVGSTCSEKLQLSRSDIGRRNSELKRCLRKQRLRKRVEEFRSGGQVEEKDIERWIRLQGFDPKDF